LCLWRYTYVPFSLFLLFDNTTGMTHLKITKDCSKISYAPVPFTPHFSYLVRLSPLIVKTLRHIFSCMFSSFFKKFPSYLHHLRWCQETNNVDSWRLKWFCIVYNDSVPTFQRSPCVYFRKTIRSVLYREITAVLLES